MAKSKYKGGDNLTEEHDNAARVLLELRGELVEQGQGKEKLLDEFLNHNFVENGTKPFRLLSMVLHPDKTPADKKEQYAKYMAAVSMVKEQGSTYTTKYIQNGIREMVQDPKIASQLLGQEEKKPTPKQQERKLPQRETSNLSEKFHDIHKHHEERKQQTHASVPPSPPKKETMPVFNGILLKSVQQEYKEVSQKQKNVIHSIKSYTGKRHKQSDYIDEIKAQLIADKKNNTFSEHEEAQILYAAMILLEKDLKNEFRWTRWLGAQSRLETIMKNDLQKLEKEFPKIADGAQKKLMEFAEKHPKLEVKEHFPELKAKTPKHK